MNQSENGTSTTGIACMKRYIKQCCAECGSDEVRRDGSLTWDVALQMWEEGGDLEAALCDECGHEELKEVPLAGSELFNAQYDAFSIALSHAAPQLVSTLATIISLKGSSGGPASLVEEFQTRARIVMAEAVDAASMEAGTPFVVISKDSMKMVIEAGHGDFYTDAWEYRDTVGELYDLFSALVYGIAEKIEGPHYFGSDVPVSIALVFMFNDPANSEIYTDDASFEPGISEFKSTVESLWQYVNAKRVP